MRTASSENQRRNSAPYVISALLSLSGLPISRVMIVASSSARAVTVSKAERRISPRSRGGTFAQSACAATAASIAALPSSTVASATCTSVEPSAGFSTANVEPPLASRQEPPMNS